MSSKRTAGAIVIGSGNIGTDLMVKIGLSERLRMAAMVGIDPASDGLARAREHGVTVTSEGVDGLRQLPELDDAEVIFDATSARAHERHAAFAREHGKLMVDLTPAALGPYVVPAVNLADTQDAPDVNMVTCGGQATIPVVAAVTRVAPVAYAEIVASIASRSAGPGTRANIDEFTETTSRAIETVGGAESGKAIIILNPAEPAMIMRDTVYCLVERDASGSEVDQDAVARSVHRMVADVQAYVPGYRLKQDVQFDPVEDTYLPALGRSVTGTRVSVFLEVAGAGHYLPAYAGNLDIMTSAAVRTAERIMELREEAAR